MTGGGSGGHITPLLAVASELKQAGNMQVVYVGQRGDKLARVVADNENIDEAKLILAGKFRRYHGEGLRQLLDIKTMFLNVRDAFLVAIGILQSIWYLLGHRPDVIFIKGGFVGVPVGLAAALLRIPYVTHDSDALAGLANRIIARWARLHAVALPQELYNYPPNKTITVGVPISNKYATVTPDIQQDFKEHLGLGRAKQLLFITGGGLGAQIINESFLAIAPRLLKEFPGLYVVHGAGHLHAGKVQKSYDGMNDEISSRVRVMSFIENQYAYSGAADVVITRAGATTMAELAMQGKACVIVPNPVLAGGHQLKNAYAYEKDKAAAVIEEQNLRQNPEVFYEVLKRLLGNNKERAELAKNLHTFANPNAAKDLAKLITAQTGDK